MHVDPMKPKLKAFGHTRLKLKYDRPLSSFAFKCNLRRFMEVTRAKLALVDLAGSERQSVTGVTGGEMFREAISINKSLFTLRKVITSLAESRYKGLHVPYRDSKLTSLLQDSLGGTSLTVMVACLSPCDGHFDENLSTLEYASRASCIANRVAVNEDPKSKLIRELRAQNAFLTAQLAHMQAAGYELPAALVGPGRLCSPRHRLQFTTGDEGLQYE